LSKKIQVPSIFSFSDSCPPRPTTKGKKTRSCWRHASKRSERRQTKRRL